MTLLRIFRRLVTDTECVPSLRTKSQILGLAFSFSLLETIANLVMNLQKYSLIMGSSYYLRIFPWRIRFIEGKSQVPELPFPLQKKLHYIDFE